MFKFLQRHKLARELTAAEADGEISRDETARLSRFDENVRWGELLRRTASLGSVIEVSHRMSPDQSDELTRIAEELGLSFFERFHDYQFFLILWGNDQGIHKLKPLDWDLGPPLRHGERYYFHAPATWFQNKVVKTLSHYSGFSTSVPLFGGVRYRVGTVRPHYDISEGLVQVAKGLLHISNKRIIMQGGEKSLQITLGSVIDIRRMANGIEVVKNNKSEFFEMGPGAAEWADALLDRMSEEGVR
jgi:hypothetical protein